MIKCNISYLIYYLVLLIISIPVIDGCSVKLISNYDEVTDRSITELQKKLETFLLKMEATAGTSEGEYVNNKAFYDETKVALSSLSLRAGAIPENTLTVQHISEIEKNIEALRQLHEQRGQKGFSKLMIDSARTAINIQFRAILTLELAKKRGK